VRLVERPPLDVDRVRLAAKRRLKVRLRIRRDVEKIEDGPSRGRRLVHHFLVDDDQRLDSKAGEPARGDCL
jgi:hypothetical protein